MTASARRMGAGRLHTIPRQPNDSGCEVVTTRDTPLAERVAWPRHMTAGARQKVAGMLLMICNQQSALRGLPQDGRGEAGHKT